jgi:cytochrome c553
MNRNALLIIGLTVASIAAGNAIAGGNIAEGEKKSAACAACHGPGGNAPTTPDYPRLAGQHEDYIENALHDYQIGARKDPIMSGMAAPLTPQDIKDLAAYFASQKGSLAAKY